MYLVEPGADSGLLTFFTNSPDFVEVLEPTEKDLEFRYDVIKMVKPKG